MEDQLEKEARFRQLMAHSSHDSAIDTDSMEWETEVVEFEKHRVRAAGTSLNMPEYVWGFFSNYIFFLKYRIWI